MAAAAHVASPRGAGMLTDWGKGENAWHWRFRIAGHSGTKLDTHRLQRWFADLVFAVAAYVRIDTVFIR